MYSTSSRYHYRHQLYIFRLGANTGTPLPSLAIVLYSAPAIICWLIRIVLLSLEFRRFTSALCEISMFGAYPARPLVTASHPNPNALRLGP